MKRDLFGSKFGLLMACVGSAVGIGNVWLFPWRIGEFGGIIFIFQYVILLVLVGVVGLIGEFTLGRLTRTGPAGSFEAAFKNKGLKGGKSLGLIPILGALGIATGYAVVVGWVLRYVLGSIDGSLFKATSQGEYFGSIVGDFGSLGYHFSALAFTLVIMLGGISKGIERANKIMMPLFYILFVILLIRVLTLDNINKGLAYLLSPKWELLLNAKAWGIALGQAFFSLSLAGSGMVVYGSYLSKKVDIAKTAVFTAFISCIGALLCAFVIMPAVVACGVSPTAGPPLVFITLPLVFKLMPMGQVFAVLFFISVLFAAITSLMNLLECPVEAVQEKFKCKRSTAVFNVGLICLGVGVFLENAKYIGVWMDVLSAYVVPIGAMLAGFCIFWMFGMKVFYKEIKEGSTTSLPSFFTPLAKYSFCFISLVIIILSIFVF